VLIVLIWAANQFEELFGGVYFVGLAQSRSPPGYVQGSAAQYKDGVSFLGHKVPVLSSDIQKSASAFRMSE
jgi:hypothetical protein